VAAKKFAAKYFFPELYRDESVTKNSQIKIYFAIKDKLLGAMQGHNKPIKSVF
jgi:hypothetical protein